MPAIIAHQDYSAWLDPNLCDIEKVKSLAAVSYQNLNIFPVSQQVNNTRYNQPDCIEPLSLSTSEKNLK
jgi:putative SOS response-associated peptidase YedK